MVYFTVLKSLIIFQYSIKVNYEDAKEQLLGIEQINDAVTMLDTQTQQNANVATNTKTIAEYTSKIAQKKEFL